MNLTEGSNASYDEDLEKCRNNIEAMKKQITIYEKLLQKYAKQESQVTNAMKNIKDSANAAFGKSNFKSRIFPTIEL